MSDDLDILAARIAELVADRLRAELPEIVDAARLAEYLGVSRDVVYANADRLGAIRLGDGDRPRLRFPLSPDTVREWQNLQHPEPTNLAPQQPRKRRAPKPAPNHLLPIGPQ